MKLRSEFRTIGVRQTETKGDVVVTLASGKPILEKSRKGVVNKVVIVPERAQYDITGYFLPDKQLASLLKEAVDNNHDVLLMFEKQRKKGVDESIPIVELSKDTKTAKDKVVNTCVGIYNFTKNTWFIEGGYSNPEDDKEDILRFVNRIKQEEVDLENFFDTPREENKVFVPNAKDFDKKQAILNLYFWLIDTEKKFAYELTEEQRRSVVEKLLKLSNHLYGKIKQVNTDDYINYGEYAHTRARMVVFRFGEVVKPLVKSELVNIKQWLKECVEYYEELDSWLNTIS